MEVASDKVARRKTSFAQADATGKIGNEAAAATSITVVLGPPTQKEGRKKPGERPVVWLLAAAWAVKIFRNPGGNLS